MDRSQGSSSRFRMRAGKFTLLAVDIAALLAAVVIGGYVVDQRTGKRLSSSVARMSENRRIRSRNLAAVVGLKESESAIVFCLSSRCPVCKRQVPVYQEIIRRTKGDGGVRLIGLFSEADSDASRYTKENQLGLEVRQGLTRTGVVATPTVIILRKGGAVIKILKGANEISVESVVGSLDSISLGS